MSNKLNASIGGKTGKFIGAGVFTAIASSLCCITPVLAFISGASGVASTFSWTEPARPYLIGVTVLVLGFAWYQKLKPRTREDIQCDCDNEENKKSTFWQSRMFLGIVTAFAAVMLAFPYYAEVFYPTNKEKEVIIIQSDQVQTVQFSIEGMTCQGCAEHIKHEVNKLTGVLQVTASYEGGNALIRFDNSKTSLEEIEQAINSTGYVVTGRTEQ